MAEKEYRRLTRPRLRYKGFALATSRSSLWLGRDHVLSIEATNFTEKYRRFYFRDLQAISIRRTKRRMTWNWILAALLIPSLFVANASRTAGAGPEVLAAILVSIIALPLIFNNALGPTCAAYFRTAVQIEEIPSLSRIRRARKTIARIRPLIVSVQEVLSPEELSARIQAMQSGKPVNIAVPVELEPEPTPENDPDPDRIEL